MDVINAQLKTILRGSQEVHMRLRLLLARQRRAHLSRWDTAKASVNG